MSVTIYDIARKAQVGIGTVSRVLNNHPNVSKLTRTRVLAVVRRLKYRPHPGARALAGKSPHSILAFVPFFPTHFFAEVLQGVQSKLNDLEWDLILYGINHPDQLDPLIARHGLRSHVNGILLFSMHLSDSSARHSRSLKTPLVLVDAYHSFFDSITVDNARGAVLATRHLIRLGHQRIGFLGANVTSTPVRERLSGFREAMSEAGLIPRPEWIKLSQSRELDGFTRETGEELMEQFIGLGRQRPTAIFVASDIQALGALQALERHRLSCPDDIALVGFDDIELARYVGLTTVRQPMFQMGALAVDIFRQRLTDGRIPVIHSRFVPELVIRRSCGSNGNPAGAQ